MPSQRPSVPFLSSFLAAFRQQQSASSALSSQQAAAKPHTSQSGASAASYATGTGAATPRTISTTAAAAAAATASRSAAAGGASVVNQLPIHSPRAGGMPIPNTTNRRRGSDSSSEGFRDVMGADKWYIGGRTAGGEEKFFKLGVVRKMKSNDGLSLDRLSL